MSQPQISLSDILAAVVARKKQEEQPVYPDPPGAGDHIGPIVLDKTIPTGSPIPRFAESMGMSGTSEELLNGFLELPPAEQLKIISDGLEGLDDQAKASVADLLKHDLNRKWIPLPGPQTSALTSEADVVLYGGAGGGGKSDTLIGLAMTEHRRSLILRRQFTDLAFLTERAIEVNGSREGFAASPQPIMKTKDGRIVEFGAAQHPGDEQKYQGRPHDFLGFDEAAQFLEGQIRFLMGWVRSTDPNQRTRVVLASNPPLSDEGQWMVKMFAPWLDPHYEDKAQPGELRYVITDEHGRDKWVDHPGPHEVGARKVMALSRTFIPAKLSDNPFLARTEYATKLDGLQEPFRSAIRDGNFMAVREDNAFQVIPSEWIRLAQQRWEKYPPEKVLMTCVAVDPAGGGADAAVIAHRYGEWFGPLRSVQGPETADGRFMSGIVFMERHNNCQTVVDIGGGYGTELLNALKENDAPVAGFRGSEASGASAKISNIPFANMRAELWYRFREALDPDGPYKIALPPDQELAADLSTPRLNDRAMEQRGVIQVELKEEIRKRLGRSTDKGDAVVMCWHYGGLLEALRREGVVKGTVRFLNNAARQTRTNSSYPKSRRMGGGRRY